MEQRIMDLLEESSQLNRRMNVAIDRQRVALQARNNLITEYNRLTRCQPEFKEDIFQMLSAMNIEDVNLFTRCYEYLCSHPLHTRCIMGMPIHFRMNRLLRYMNEGV